MRVGKMSWLRSGMSCFATYANDFLMPSSLFRDALGHSVSDIQRP